MFIVRRYNSIDIDQDDEKPIRTNWNTVQLDKDVLIFENKAF